MPIGSAARPEGAGAGGPFEEGRDVKKVGEVGSQRGRDGPLLVTALALSLLMWVAIGWFLVNLLL